MNIQWIKPPELAGVTFTHGTGKSVVTGTVRIAFTSADMVFVTTDAHVNDHAPAVNFRDREWLVSEHFIRSDDGTWSVSDPTHNYGISNRDVFGSGDHTPPTHRAAILAALIACVAEHWTPEYARQARHAKAARTLHHDMPERDKLAAQLAELDARIAVIRAEYDATA